MALPPKTALLYQILFRQPEMDKELAANIRGLKTMLASIESYWHSQWTAYLGELGVRGRDSEAEVKGQYFYVPLSEEKAYLSSLDRLKTGSYYKNLTYDDELKALRKQCTRAKRALYAHIKAWRKVRTRARSRIKKHLRQRRR